MRRFGQMKPLQDFAEARASVDNHLTLERRSINRLAYEERRTAALAAWRGIAS